MNICICISGQVRGSLFGLRFLKQQLVEINKKFPDYHFVIIVSAWRNVSAKIDGAMGAHQLTRVFDGELLPYIPITIINDNLSGIHMKKTFDYIREKESKDAHQLLSQIFPDAILDIEDEVMLLEFDKERADKNTLKMLYKRWRCNEIKRKYEQEHAIKFDWVVVMRPDYFIKFHDKFFSEKVLDNTLYVPRSDNDQFMFDHFAYGSSRVIDIYNRVFSLAVSNELEWIHRGLKYYIKANNIEECYHLNVQPLWFEKNNTIGIDEVKDTSYLFPLMQLDDSQEKLSKIEDFTISAQNNNEHKGRICAYKLYIAKMYNEFQQPERVIDNIINGYFLGFDIGLKSFPNFTRDKIYDLLILSCNRMGMDSIDCALGYFRSVLGKITDEQQDFFVKNIENFANDKKVVYRIENPKISLAIDELNIGEIDNLLKENDILFDMIIAKSRMYEEDENLVENSLNLMKLASKMKPDADWIKSKIHTFTMMIESKRMLSAGNKEESQNETTDI